MNSSVRQPNVLATAICLLVTHPKGGSGSSDYSLSRRAVRRDALHDRLVSMAPTPFITPISGGGIIGQF